MKVVIKIILWSAAAVVLLVALLAGTFVLLVQHSPGFRQYLLAKVETSVYESSRARLQARDFRLSLSSMSVAMDDVVLRGTEPAQADPLLRIDRLETAIAIDSVMGRRWHLRAMTIEHPVVHFVVDKSGNNNLPKAPAKSSSSSKTELFDLGVRRLVLRRGEIYFNDHQSRLEADLQHLELSAHFEPAATEYRGRLGYDQGKITYATYTPVMHSLKADFALNPRKISVEHLQLLAGKSSFAGNATVEGYSGPNPRLLANYDALLATSELARILALPQAPAGEVRLTGFLSYQNPDKRPLLEAVSLWGMLTSPELSVHSATLQTKVRNIAAKYKLENGTAEVQNLRANILGGTLEGRATVRDIAGKGEGRLQASLNDVSLSVLQTASANNPMREAHLTGTVNADAEATWGKALANLAARANMRLKASLGESPAMPLEGVIHADYSQPARVALHNSYLRTPQTSLTLDGTISRFSHLQFRLQARDLHEAELLVKSFQPSTSGPQRSVLGLYGAGQMQGTLAGARDRLQLRAQMGLTNFGMKGSRWKSLRAAINADSSQITVSEGELVGALQGRIAFSLQSVLRNWKYSPSNPISARIRASSISLADLDRLANRDDPVTGTLALDLAIQGTQLNPRGHGSLVLENATVAQEKIQHADAQFQGNGEVVNLALHARMPAGNSEGSLTYHPKTETYQAQLKAGNLRIEKFATVAARNVQIAGAMDVNVEGAGTLSRPEFTATVAIPVLQLRRQALEGINFQAHVREGVAQIAFDSRVAQTYVKASGTVGMTRPFQADVTLDTGNIPIQDLLALYSPGRPEGLSAETALHAAVRGPLADKSLLELHVEAPTLTASYKDFHLAAVKPIRLDYRDGIAVLQPSSIQGTGTDIQMEATIPVKNPAAAKYLVRGKIDLRAVQLLQPGVQSSGQLEFDVDSRRYGGSSGIQGVVRIRDAAVHIATLSLGLEHGNGLLNVSSDRLQISNFQGQVGGGTVTANGAVTYRPHIQSNIALAAKGVRVRYPEGLRTVLDSNLRLAGSPADSVLSGQVSIDHISFTPDFDLSRFTAQLGEQDVSTPSGLAQNMKLDLTLQSTSEVNLSSNQLSLQGRADMRVAGTAASPVLLGRANLNGGEMFLAGNRYVVQNGTVDFLNPVRTEPVVNLQVRTEVDQYNITLNITGPMERLHINYTSDPALPPADIINLLAFGKTKEAQAAASPGFSTAGAQSLLAQGIGNVVSTGVAKFAGLPHVSIDPALRGSGQDSGARISVQQRVSSNLFVTYSTDVTQTQRPAIGVDYQLNRRWSIRGTRDQNGGFGVSGRYRKDF